MAYRLCSGVAVSGRALTISIDELLSLRPIPNSSFVIPVRNNDDTEPGQRGIVRVFNLHPRGGIGGQLLWRTGSSRPTLRSLSELTSCSDRRSANHLNANQKKMG